jgi:hypothetical protein
MSEKSVKSNNKTASPKSKKAPAAKSESTSSSEGSKSSKGGSEPTSAPGSDEAAPKLANESGKSSKESVGGKDAVHYGFFSNIKTPEYRSGWDDIWAKTKKPGKPRKKEKKEPLILEIKFAELPPTIQEGLADVARVKMKKSRISYDSREKKGGVSWNLSCEVKR